LLTKCKDEPSGHDMSAPDGSADRVLIPKNRGSLWFAMEIVDGEAFGRGCGGERFD
jgi:hypothetical protein